MYQGERYMKKVLITDDEPRIVRLIKGMIDWEGLSLELAGEALDGFEALRLIKERAVDILIADIRMPGMDGLQLISRGMELKPDLSVIIISGYKEFDYVYSALKKGVCDYLLKPINKFDLDRSLRRILNMQQANRIVLQGELKHYQRQRMVTDCVHGIADIDDSLERFNARHGFRFQQGIFGALIVTLAFQDELPSLGAVLSKTEDSIHAVLAPLCCDLEYTSFQNYCCCIFNCLEDKKEEVRQSLGELKKALDQRIAKAFSLPVIMGVGYFYREVVHLSLCCAQALLCCRSASLVDCRQVIFAEELQVGQPYSILTGRYADLFRSTVSKYDSEAIGQCMREISQNIEPVLQRHPWQLEYFLKELVELFRKEMAAGNIMIDSEETERVVRQLLLQTDWSCLLERLTKWFSEKIECYHNTITDQYREPIRAARRYIDIHYAEQLSLTQICGEVGFSYNYFSTLFKQETGQGITDYITQVRIAHAKELLVTTRDSIQKIANQTGYLDVKHFNKTFSKEVGIRPLEYRRIKS